MTKDEALKLALEALERSVATCFDQRSHDEVMGRPEHFVNKAIDAIKEALAQEQEPVAWMDEYGDVLSASVVSGKGLRNIPLYTAPPKRTWVGLTDEEMYRYCPIWLAQADFKALILHIESKLKNKNTRGQE